MIITGGCLFKRTSMLVRNALQDHTRAEQVRIPGEEYHEKVHSRRSEFHDAGSAQETSSGCPEFPGSAGYCPGWSMA